MTLVGVSQAQFFGARVEALFSAVIAGTLQADGVNASAADVTIIAVLPVPPNGLGCVIQVRGCVRVCDIVCVAVCVCGYVCGCVRV